MKVYLDGERRYIDCITFSGGEIHANVSHLPRAVHSIGLVAPVRSSDDLMEALMVAEALNAWCFSATDKTVWIPYMPYSRQDRRCAKGDSFSLMVMGKILRLFNQVGFKIVTADIHSEEGLSIIKSQGVTDIVNHNLARDIIEMNLRDFYDHTLCAPDLGATKRVREISENTGLPFIQGYKKRDPRTGNLSGFGVHCDSLKDQDILIVDDICDGGGTFIGLAKELKKKGCKSISLFVTHGIFSKGLDVFVGEIDKIYTTSGFCRKEAQHASPVPLKVFNYT